MSKPEEDFLEALEEAVTCQRSRGGICEICRVNLRNAYEKIVGEDWERRDDLLRRLNAGEPPDKTHRSLAERENDWKGLVPPSFGFGEDANSIGEQRTPEEPVKPRCPECGETEFFIHQQPMTGVEVTCMQVTSRHKQILKLLLAGKINKEIAAELNLSEHVVKNEIRAIFKHFGIHRRCEIFPILETVRQSL